MAQLRNRGEDLAADDPNLRIGPILDRQLAYVKHSTASQAYLMVELEFLCVNDGDALMNSVDVVAFRT